MKHSLDLKSDDIVWAWNNNVEGELVANTLHIYPPRQLNDNLLKYHGECMNCTVTAQSGPGRTAGRCLLDVDSQEGCHTPVRAQGPKDVVAVEQTDESCSRYAITKDGTLWTLGRNENWLPGVGGSSKDSTKARVQIIVKEYQCDILLILMTCYLCAYPVSCTV